MASARSQAMMAVFQKWSTPVKDIMFADRLVSLVVKQVFSPAMLKAKSLTTKYEKIWAGYHELVIGNEPSSLWHSTFECVENPLHFQQFMQLVTRRVMDEAVKTAFVFESKATASPQAQKLKADEEQALRYVAGYVPMKLKNTKSSQTTHVL